ncbi:protein brambleberry-like [Bacillus rossius redtenbacheri]|uniref:protein brambleberry-like n=1 Tax=Bacillus rossius redtenbacheri TaxID=93214 RepID=UPI002FDD4DE3
MKMNSILACWCLLLIFSSSVGLSGSSFLDWFLPSSIHVDNDGTDIQAVFTTSHLKSDEERFLEEAKEHLKMSPNDICQHKIMLKLKSSCSALSEEALLKISVNLLNCQSEIEGRKIVACTEEMTLKECTKAMDTTTWNLYHMMSVRAKSVCYLRRQQQFNAYSDMMMSRLTSAAQNQAATMSLLEEMQEKLQLMAFETFGFLSKAQKVLEVRETKATAQKKKLDEAIEANIQAVEAHRVLIAEAKEDLSIFVEDIKSTFDASGSTNINSTHIQEVQQDILALLSKFKNNSETYWKKIDASFSASHIVLQKIRLQKEELVYKINAISNVVNSTITAMRNVVNNTIFVLSGLFCLVCEKGDPTARIWCYVQNILLIVGTLLLWFFLRLEFRTFLLIIHCNFILYHWRLNYPFKNSSLTVEIFWFIIGLWFCLKLFKFILKQRNVFSIESSVVAQRIVGRVSSVEHLIKNFVGAIWKKIVSTFTGTNYHHKQNVPRESHLPGQPLDTLQHSDSHPSRVPTPPYQPSFRPTSSRQSSRTPTPLRWPSTSTLQSPTSASPAYFRSSTPVPSVASSSVSTILEQSSFHSDTSDRNPSCRAMCKTGKLCRKTALIGEEFCYTHLR